MDPAFRRGDGECGKHGVSAAASSFLAHSDAGLALEEHEVEGWGEVAAADPGEQAMRLAAMMGLVIEEMGERRPKRLGDVRRIGDRPIGEGAGEVGFGQRLDVEDDALVFVAPRDTEAGEIVVGDPFSFVCTGPSPVKRRIQMRSPTRRWFSVRWTEPKKAPRSAR